MSMKDQWTCVENTVVDPYDTACKEFVEDDAKFASFKQDRRYTAVLEHVDPNHGRQYLEQIKRHKSQTIATDIDKFKENDMLGSPSSIMYEHPFGMVSPSTLRYIKNTYDILDFVGSEKCDRVAEIGGGYGGLCKCLSKKLNFSEYVIYDIPSACLLAKKYLSNFDVGARTKHFSNCESDGIFDLVISNYAYSELGENLQRVYYENVISQSKRAYMILNKGQVDREEFLSRASKDFDIRVEKVLDFWPPNGFLYYVTMVKRDINP